MSFMIFPLVLALIIIVLFGSHYFVYLSAIRFWTISPAHQNILMTVLLFMMLSYIPASLLAGWKENILTRSLYTISGLWYGFLINFLLASLLCWLFLSVFKWANLSVSPALLGTIFLISAILFSLYGIWNAQHPQIRHITVSIPNLPDNWKGKKIIQLSDVHLGNTNRESFLSRIIDQTNATDPDLVVITGDLFDGMDGDLDSLAKLLDNLKGPRGVYFVTGNHETYLGLDEVFKALGKTKVRIMTDEVVDVDGLKLIGINYPSRQEDKNISEKIKNLQDDFAGKPNVLLYHSPSNIEAFKNSGVNLQLSGHTHKGQLFPLNIITSLVYHGFDYGLYRSGNYTLYTTNGTGSWGPTMRTGNTPEIVEITLR